MEEFNYLVDIGGAAFSCPHHSIQLEFALPEDDRQVSPRQGARFHPCPVHVDEFHGLFIAVGIEGAPPWKGAEAEHVAPRPPEPLEERVKLPGEEIHYAGPLHHHRTIFSYHDEGMGIYRSSGCIHAEVFAPQPIPYFWPRGKDPGNAWFFVSFLQLLIVVGEIMGIIRIHYKPREFRFGMHLPDIALPMYVWLVKYKRHVSHFQEQPFSLFSVGAYLFFIVIIPFRELGHFLPGRDPVIPWEPFRHQPPGADSPGWEMDGFKEAVQPTIPGHSYPLPYRYKHARALAPTAPELAVGVGMFHVHYGRCPAFEAFGGAFELVVVHIHILTSLSFHR